MVDNKDKEDNELRSLEDLINEELSELNVPKRFRSLDMFITDGKKCADFIRSFLNDESFDIPEEASDLYEIAEMRARHSVVTFLVGMVFKRFAGLFDSIPTVINMNGKENAMKMWLLTSLCHDKAYFSAYIKQPKLNIQEHFKPFLLTDDVQSSQMGSLRHYSLCYPQTMAHTYETMLKYDKYAVYYHGTHDSTEKRDHGILGGVMMFSDLAKKDTKQQQGTTLPIIKACSLAVAQHNIFKSCEKYDEKYREFGLDTLLSTSNFKIGKETTLLFFLSLVDTIECVKKFSKSNNKNRYLESLTTLKRFKMSINADRIFVDLSGLDREIKAKKSDELSQAFVGYKNSLKDMGSWMAIEVKVEPNDDNGFGFHLDRAIKEKEHELAVAGSANG